MPRRIAWVAAITVMLAAVTGTIPAANAQEGVKAGILHCKKVPGSGVNLIIHSSSVVTCEFISSKGTEFYKGEAGIGFGIDLEWSDDKVISYTVIARAEDVAPGAYALAGKYYGARASATVGVGAGAQVLAGGGDKNVSLQPLALESGTGLGAAVGLGYLYLEPDK